MASLTPPPPFAPPFFQGNMETKKETAHLSTFFVFRTSLAHPLCRVPRPRSRLSDGLMALLEVPPQLRELVDGRGQVVGVQGQVLLHDAQQVFYA